jgi:TRAP-type mannitol/chloroaromatic compound transport system substrate-binding protein
VLWLSLFEAVAAAAAVAMPANASKNPQARMERRNTFPPQVDCKSEAERAGYALKRAPLGAAYAIVVSRVAAVVTLVRW